MDIELLERMTRFNAVVSHEYPFAVWLMEQLEPHATRVEMDRLGNVYAWRGEAPRVGIFCHMDNVGFLVEEVHEGHVKVVKMGGPATPNYAPMVVETEEGEAPGTLLVKDDTYLIDLWRKEASEKVQVGDIAAFAPNFRAEHGVIMSRSLDNKLGTWVAFEAWKQCERAVFVATVREEHSPQGAGAAARYLEGLEVAIVVDITYSSSPQGPYIVEWGKGPAVTYRDASLYDRRWVKAMLEVGKRHGIPVQPEIALSGGSDAHPIQLAGVPAIFVGLPIRYAHTPAEVTQVVDSERARELIARFVEEYPEGRLEGPTRPNGSP